MEFATIFPTLIGKTKIDEKLIKKALDLCEDRHRERSMIEQIDMDNDLYWDDILHTKELAFFHQEIINASLPALPHNDNILSQWNICSAWSSLCTPNETNFEIHSHIESFMSAVVYLKGKGMSIAFHDAPREASCDQHHQPNYELIVRHTFNQPISFDMEEGDLIVFPSHLAHKGNDNHTDENRICFAYNFLPSRLTQFETSQPPWYLDQNQLVNSFKD